MKVYLKQAASAAFLTGLFLVFLTSASGQNPFRKIMDFDGDGRADYAVTRDINGSRFWYIWQSTAGFRVEQFGLSIDENAPGDYDGDSKTDVATFRKEPLPQSSMRYTFFANGSQRGVFGNVYSTNANPDAYAIAQDYDGDGRDDMSWSINNNQGIFIMWATGGTIGGTTPGGGFPIKRGDISGDRKADITSVNPNTNVVTTRNSSTLTNQIVAFGAPGDKYMPTDFDGDGRGDLAVFRPSNGDWYWLRSSDGTFQGAHWGAPGDVPVPADYDGDGKTDLAVWRGGEQSNYFIYGSQIGFFGLAWGIGSDTVVRY